MRRALPAIVIAALALCTASVSHAAPRGSLEVKIEQPPGPAVGTVSVRGPGGYRRVVRRSTVLSGLKPGTYRLSAGKAKYKKQWRTIKRGAVALPNRSRFSLRVLKARRTVTVLYGTVRNPRVQKAPAGIIGVDGDPTEPAAIRYGKGARLPKAGTIITSAPTTTLPRGLVAKVTGVSRTADGATVQVTPVSFTEAIPQFKLAKPVALRDAAAAKASASQVPRARAASVQCGVDLFQTSVDIDSFEIRGAEWGPLLGTVKFSIAQRSSTKFGIANALSNFHCSFGLAELGPFQGAIPTTPPIPVYASFPLTFTAGVNGSLGPLSLDFTTTSVLGIWFGLSGGVDFHTENSSVKFTGTPTISGSADIGVAAKLELGVGNSKVADVHVAAGIDLMLTMDGKTCVGNVGLGSLSAGVHVAFLEASTPSWSPFNIKVLDEPCEWGSPDPDSPGGTTTTPSTPGSGTGWPVDDQEASSAMRVWFGAASVWGESSVGSPDWVSCARPELCIAGGNGVVGVIVKGSGGFREAAVIPFSSPPRQSLLDFGISEEDVTALLRVG